MTWLLGLASSKWFRWVAIGVVALLFIGIVVLRIFNAGKAAEKTQAVLDTLTRTLQARKAAAEADTSEEFKRHDPYNLDR